MLMFPCFHTCIFPYTNAQVLKFSSSGDTWVENSPYHSPDITKLVRPAQEQAKPEPVTNAEEGEFATIAPFIPTPPPLPPILSPVSEEEEEEEEEREQVELEEGESRKVCKCDGSLDL